MALHILAASIYGQIETSLNVCVGVREEQWCKCVPMAHGKLLSVSINKLVQ